MSRLKELFAGFRGLGASGVSRRGQSRRTILRLEGLEDRTCPSIITNYWQPQGNSRLASVATNWSAGHVPNTDDQAIGFDPTRTNGNAPIEVDTSITTSLVVWANSYSQVMTIDSGVTLEAQNGFNFGLGTANIDFKATTSKLQADGGNSQLNNFEFTDAHGTFYVKSGTLTVGNSAASDTFSDFLIAGILTVNNTATAKFQAGASLTIASGGQMTLSNTKIASLWSPAANPGLLENWGTFTYAGDANDPNPTEIDMPFLNHGDATFDGGHHSTGKLKITNKSTATNGYSLMMDGGTITLKNGMDLGIDQGYVQTGGTFSVADSITARLSILTTNNAEFDGGKVQLGTATTFGDLWVWGGDVTFNGAEYDAKINGRTALQSDTIETNGYTFHIKGTSKLVVTAVGQVARNLLWKIILDLSSTNAVDGDFSDKSLPAGVTGPNPLPPQRGTYELDS